MITFMFSMMGIVDFGEGRSSQQPSVMYYLGLSTATLAGLIWGRFLGMALFEPSTRIWLAGMFLGAVLGFVIGSSAGFWVFGAQLSIATFGLYLGWAFAASLFGEHLGGEGFLISMGGAIIGWRIGRRSELREFSPILGALIGGLHSGFLLGGLLYMATSQLFILSPWKGCLILWQGVGVFVCAIPGALLGWYLIREAERKA